MRSTLERFVGLLRYSDSELSEVSLGILVWVMVAAPERLHWMGPVAQGILCVLGALRCWASLGCGLPARQALNFASVVLFGAMFGAEVHHDGVGDELFLLATSGVAIWCLYRTSYELAARIDMNKGK